MDNVKTHWQSISLDILTIQFVEMPYIHVIDIEFIVNTTYDWNQFILHTYFVT
jgi:hypothetical protein